MYPQVVKIVMAPKDKKVMILVMLIILAILGILGILGIVIRNKYTTYWPIKFNLYNTSSNDSSVEVYLNDTFVSNLIIKSGQSIPIKLGDSQIINPRTSKPYTRDQVKYMTVRMLNDGEIVFSSNNLSPYTLVLANNLSGYNAISTNPGFTWNKSGYYVFTFTNGISLV